MNRICCSLGQANERSRFMNRNAHAKLPDLRITTAPICTYTPLTPHRPMAPHRKNQTTKSTSIKMSFNIAAYENATQSPHLNVSLPLDTKMRTSHHYHSLQHLSCACPCPGRPTSVAQQLIHGCWQGYRCSSPQVQPLELGMCLQNDRRPPAPFLSATP